MTATPLSTVTMYIRKWEREQAPGSETQLWGEYVKRMRDITGVTDVENSDAPVPEAEAEWWYKAYGLQGARPEMDIAEIIATLS